MEPQARRKSNIFAYVLLGLIIFIIMILFFGKHYSFHNQSLSSTSSQDAVIKALMKDRPITDSVSEEQQSKVIAELKKSSSASNDSITADQQVQIMNQLKTQ